MLPWWAGLKTQGKDASEGIEDAIKSFGMHPSVLHDVRKTTHEVPHELWHCVRVLGEPGQLIEAG